MKAGKDGYLVTVGGETHELKLKRGSAADSFVALFSGRPVPVTLVRADSQQVELFVGGERMIYIRPAALIAKSVLEAAPMPKSKDLVISPMPGKVIGALVTKGEKVKNGDPLVILESMKMEIAVRADRDAEVLEILVSDGEAVKRGQGLVRLG